jgi:hypothetical protein
VADQAHSAVVDLFVDARSILGRGRLLVKSSYVSSPDVVDDADIGAREAAFNRSLLMRKTTVQAD